MTGRGGAGGTGHNPSGSASRPERPRGADDRPRVAHVAVVVRRLSEAEGVYSGQLALPPVGRETLPAEGVSILFLAVGQCTVELMEPRDSEEPLGRFLKTRGETVHHVAVEVPDIEAAVERARSAGLRLIDSAPRRGAHGTRVAFIHPQSTGGLLVELVERFDGRTP